MFRTDAPSLPRLAAAVALSCALTLPAAAAAQVVTADEGSFTVSRGGARIGREEFRIVRQPAAGGQEYVARGQMAYGDRRMTAALRTDAAGAPLGYQVEVRNGPETETRLTGTIVHGRFSAQVRTPRGEAASEFPAGEGTVIVDDEVFHQYYFLSLGGRLAGAASDVPVLVPRHNAQGTVRVSRQGSDPVAIGGQSVAATRLVVTSVGAPERQVWVDGSGRVLKVALPSQGVVALRDDPPAR